MLAQQLESSEFVGLSATKEKGVVYFEGYICDTPDLAILENINWENVICDFSNLSSASWIGLIELGNFFLFRDIKCHFKNMKYPIYEAMRMIPTFNQHDFDAAEFQVFDLLENKILFKKIKIFEYNRKLSKGEDFFTIQQYNVLSPGRYWNPAQKKQRLSPHFKFKYLHPNIDNNTFWLQYCLFSNSTIHAAYDLLNASQLNIKDISKEIHQRISQGEQGIKIIKPESKTNYHLIQKFSDMIQSIDEIFSQISKEHTPAFNNISLQIYHFIESIGFVHNFDEPVIREKLTTYFQSLSGIEVVAKKSENFGVDIGNSIKNARASHSLKMAYATIKSLNSEQLNDIRQLFSISDPTSEDSWPVTRSIILQEFSKIDHLIERCMITLQGFDLAKQILEHRLTESQMILDAIKQKKQNILFDTHTREELVNLVGKHMVSDQEKTAFEFYLPLDFQTIAQERINPGEVLLF